MEIGKVSQTLFKIRPAGVLSKKDMGAWKIVWSMPKKSFWDVRRPTDTRRNARINKNIELPIAIATYTRMSILVLIIGAMSRVGGDAHAIHSYFQVETPEKESMISIWLEPRHHHILLLNKTNRPFCWQTMFPSPHLAESVSI